MLHGQRQSHMLKLSWAVPLLPSPQLLLTHTDKFGNLGHRAILSHTARHATVWHIAVLLSNIF